MFVITKRLIARLMRRERDSNPWYPFEVHTLSRRAPSTTRTPLLFYLTKSAVKLQIISEPKKFFVQKINNFFT